MASAAPEKNWPEGEQAVSSAAQSSPPSLLLGSLLHQGVPPAAAPALSTQAEGSAGLRCRPVHTPALQALLSAGVSCAQGRPTPSQLATGAVGLVFGLCSLGVGLPGKAFKRRARERQLPACWQPHLRALHHRLSGRQHRAQCGQVGGGAVLHAAVLLRGVLAGSLLRVQHQLGAAHAVRDGGRCAALGATSGRGGSGAGRAACGGRGHAAVSVGGADTKSGHKLIHAHLRWRR